MSSHQSDIDWPPPASAAEIENVGKWDYLDAPLAALTKDTVAAAVTDMRLPLSSGFSASWLAFAVTRAIAVSLPDTSENPEVMRSNTEIGKTLKSLGKKASTLWVELQSLDQDADYAIWDHLEQMGEAFEVWSQKKRELELMSIILLGAARSVTVGHRQQPPRWRDQLKRRDRIQRVQLLAPIFEAATGRKATSNDYPSGKASKPTAFMEFYQRMVELALEERATLDLAAIAKVGLARHRKQPAELAFGLIPGYPHPIRDRPR